MLRQLLRQSSSQSSSNPFSQLTIHLFIFVAGATMANAEVVVNYIGDLESYPTIEHHTTADGFYGNLGQPGGVVTSEEAYSNLGIATTFDPMAGDAVCDVGFTIEALHMVLVKFNSEPATIYPNLAIGNAFLREDYPPEASCFWPTPCPPGSYNYFRNCYSEATITLDTPGYYEIVFTGDFSDCGCIYTNYTHTIASWIFYMDGNIRFVTDDNSSHCPDHFASTYFSGACIWREFDAPGNILYWAEVTCCDMPVATEALSWDALKSIYR